MGKKPTDANADNSYKWYGAVLGIAGFIVLLMGGLTILGLLSLSGLWPVVLALVGLALLVAGCAIFGYSWTGRDWPGKELTSSAKWSLLATLVVTVSIAFMALWADKANNVLWTVVSVGALGGLVHEIAQSKGTAFLPGQGNQKPRQETSHDTGHETGHDGERDPGKAEKGGHDGDEKADHGGDDKDSGDSGKGEDYLGGLVGVILGGAAGLLTLGATSGAQIPTQVGVPVLVGTFSAGIALKGISDSAASPTVKQGAQK